VKIGSKLIARKLGFRNLLDVIPLDANLVKGSHGRAPTTPETGPLLITSEPQLLEAASLGATDIQKLTLRHLFD
jgi:hypothetical protein